MPLRLLLALSAWLARFTSPFVAAMAVVAFVEPRAFAWVRGDAQTAILGVIMLTMGMTLSKRDFAILAKRPLDIAIGAAAQYTVMPLVAFGVSRALRLDPALATGLVLVGCCPGGVSSNIMSFLCKGDVAFSVGMTTVSTLLAPIATPTLVLLLAGTRVDVDALGMFRSILLVTILPVALGFALNAALGRTRAWSHIVRLAPGVAVVGLGCIVGGVTSADGAFFLKSGAVIFLAILLHNFGGYAIGYAVGRLFGMDRAKKRTLSIEVGMQNAGLGTVLAHRHFPAMPGAEVVAAVSCVWHSVSGAVLANAFSFFDERRARRGDGPKSAPDLCPHADL